jgi:hypothetical protein
VKHLEDEAAELAAREEARRLEHEQQQRLREDADVTRRDSAVRAAEAVSMLNELNRESIPAASAEPAPQRRREPVVEEQVAEEVSGGPEPMVARDHADTAMLLRELSSLGFSDDDERPTPAPPRPPTSRPPSASGKDKKRKGLFGRG